jgi:hypothetical protein
MDQWQGMHATRERESVGQTHLFFILQFIVTNKYDLKVAEHFQH